MNKDNIKKVVDMGVEVAIVVGGKVSAILGADASDVEFGLAMSGSKAVKGGN